jgi:hypothetical protein
MMCDLLRKKMKNAHFTLRVKAKVELKSSIPIGTIVEISLTRSQGWKKDKLNLSWNGSDWASRHFKKKTYQLERPTSTLDLLVSSSFHVSSFSSLLFLLSFNACL